MYNKINDCDNFTTNRDSVASTKLLERLSDKYKVKPYNEQFKGLRIATTGLSYLVNFLSIATAFSCIYFLLIAIIPGYKIVIAALTSIILLVLELLKRFTIPKVIELYLTRNKISIGFTISSLLLVLCSASISYKGTNDLMKQTTTTLINVDSIKQAYQVKTTKLENEVTFINTGDSYKYKGKINRTGRKRIEYLQTRITDLQQQRKEDINKATKQNKTSLEEFKSSMERSTKSLSLVAIFLDLILIVSLVYLEIYDYYSYLDLKLMNDNSSSENDDDDNKDITVDSSSVTSKPMVAPTEDKTTVNQLNANCLDCSKPFERKNARKLYCSTKCRLSAYHKRTGKNLKIASKYS